MNTYKIYIIIIGLLIFQSCKDATNTLFKSKGSDKLIVDNSKLEEIIINPDNSALIIDSILDKVDWIKLETKSNCLFGKADKIIFDDSLIFILDREVTNQLLLFKLSGKFVRKIAEKGKGPGEYVKIGDFYIMPKEKKIAIWDEYGYKIIYFSYSGKFLNEQKVPFSFRGFNILDSNTLVYYIGNTAGNLLPTIKNYQLAIGSKEFDIYSKAYPLSENQVLRKFSFDVKNSPIWNYNNKVYFNPPFSNFYYIVTRDSLHGAYFFNLKNKSIPVDLFDKLDDDLFNQIRNKYRFSNGNFIDLKDYLYTAMTTPEGYQHIFYSKGTKKIYSGIGFIADSFIYSFFSVPVTRYRENTLVSVQQANDLLLYKESTAFKTLDHDNNILNLFNNIKSNDNPILIFYDLKKF